MINLQTGFSKASFLRLFHGKTRFLVVQHSLTFRNQRPKGYYAVKLTFLYVQVAYVISVALSLLSFSKNPRQNVLDLLITCAIINIKSWYFISYCQHCYVVARNRQVCFHTIPSDFVIWSLCFPSAFLQSIKGSPPQLPSFRCFLFCDGFDSVH